MSGGVALQAETFGAEHLRKSLGKFFAHDSAQDEELSLGYRCSLELRVSKECSSALLLGGSEGEVSESGDAKTYSWSIGAVDTYTTTGFTLKRADAPSASSAQQGGGDDPNACLIQLSATYRHASGGTRMRVSTIRIPKLQQSTPMMHLLPAFDQLAAAAIAVRVAVHQAEVQGATPPDLLSAIDRNLIRMMKSLCEYQKGDPASVMLPPHCAQLPGIIFHLRRSPAVRTSGLSPDETAYFRQLVSTLGLFSTLVLVQPTLTAYDRGGHPPRQLPLDPTAASPDRSLLLDTYLKLILCHGANIGQMRRSEDAASNSELQQLESTSHAELEKRSNERFPAPEVFECEQYASKARYLVQKLNPDVPFTTFLQGLYKAVVS